MELMIDSFMFICVEVMDVVNVVLDGIDVVMFLVEIVVGNFFIEIVVVMVCVCEGVEIYFSVKIFKYCMD